MSELLFDSNAYVRLWRGQTDLLEALDVADRVFMSVIVLGELHAGFRKGSRLRENLAVLSAFLAKTTVEVLNVTEETALLYGRIRNDLRGRGEPIPTNDTWLAAQAMERGAVLVTYDGHFDRIAGLRLWPETGLTE